MSRKAEITGNRLSDLETDPPNCWWQSWQSEVEEIYRVEFTDDNILQTFTSVLKSEKKVVGTYGDELFSSVQRGKLAYYVHTLRRKER